jgi:hypothetical protein
MERVPGEGETGMVEQRRRQINLAEKVAAQYSQMRYRLKLPLRYPSHWTTRAC